MAKAVRRLLALTVAGGLLVLAAACSSPSTPHKQTNNAVTPTASASANPADQVAGGGDFALPIDGYAYTAPQNTDIVLAQSILTGNCMQKFGFSYDVRSDQSSLRKASQVNLQNFGLYGNKRRYGVTDGAVARKYGYHLPSVVDGTVPAQPSKGGAAHGYQTMTPAMNAVLTGTTPSGGRPAAVNGQSVPDGGCQGEAHRTLTALGTVGEIPIVGQIRADSFTRSLSAPTVTATFTKWSACMSAKGYQYDTPQNAGADLNIDTPTVSAREQAIASADVACKQSTGVVKVWSDFEINYENKQIDQHAQELRQVRSSDGDLIKKVDEIIAGAGK